MAERRRCSSGSSSSNHSVSGSTTVSSPPDEQPTGYPPTVCKDAPGPRYLCSPVLLKGALQSPRGRRHCSACLAWIVGNNNKPICQTCKKDNPSTIKEESLLSIEKAFSDAAINKEISELAVHCGVRGCNWTGAMKNLEDHQSTCKYALIPCHICREVVMRKKLAEHLRTSCLNAIPCSDSSQKVSGNKQQNLSMVSSEEGCRFFVIGCQFKGNAEDRKEHERNAAGIHLILLLQHQLRASSGACTRLTDSEVLTGIVNRKLQGALEMDSFSGLPVCEEAACGQTLSERAKRVCLLQNKLEVCEGIASVLSKELATSCQKIQGRRGLDQDTICALELKIADLQRCLAQKDAALVRLEERLHFSKQASYDGTFLWKITDVHQKLFEAMCGKVCSFQSPAFYTSRYGYKLCMKIFLNGEGRAMGTHLSLFIVLLRGDYDALLQWPFMHKITFTLLSHNPGDHLLNTIQPEPTSTSFQRPVAEMNEACGFPRFVSLAKLQSPTYAYIREGTLFLKCIIEASS